VWENFPSFPRFLRPGAAIYRESKEMRVKLTVFPLGDGRLFPTCRLETHQFHLFATCGSTTTIPIIQLIRWWKGEQHAFVDIVAACNKNEKNQNFVGIVAAETGNFTAIAIATVHIYTYMHIGVGLGNAIATPHPGSGVDLLCSTFQLAPLANTPAHPQKFA